MATVGKDSVDRVILDACTCCVVRGRCSNRGKERKKAVLCICAGPDL